MSNGSGILNRRVSEAVRREVFQFCFHSDLPKSEKIQSTQSKKVIGVRM